MLTRSSPLARYGFALLCVLAALVVRLALQPFLQAAAPLILFVPAVLAAATAGGLGPGLLATGLSLALGTALFIEPFGHSARDLDEVTRLVIFLVIGVGVSLLARALRRTRAALDSRIEELARSEEQYRSLFEGSLDAIFSLSRDGHFVTANPATVRLVGRSLEELKAMPFVELCVPEERERSAQAFRAAIGRRGLSLETVVLAADGTRRSIFLSGAPVVVAGETVGVSCIARDVTERNEAIARLQASEERLRLFIEHAPAAISMLDRDLCYLAASRRWREDYGQDRELVGRCHYDVFPDLPEQWKEVHRRALAGETLHSDGDRYPRENGMVQWLRWDVLPWRRAGGEIGGILIASEDITARRAAEEKLAQELHRLQTIQEALALGAPDELPLGQPLVETRTLPAAPAPVVTHAEAVRRAELFDGPREKAFDQVTQLASCVLAAPVSLFTVIASERPFFASAHGWPEPLPTERPRPLSTSCCPLVIESEGPVVIRDASANPLVGGIGAWAEGLVSYLSVPVRDRAGTVVASLSVADARPRDWTRRDQLLLEGLARLLMRELENRAITRELRDATEEVRRLNAALEERVRERTRQLEEVNRDLESFSYGVSHDLRAPLRAVNGFSAILLEEHGAQLDEEGRRLAHVIIREGQRMGQLIDDLLAFSQLGRQALHGAPLEMRRLAEEAYAEVCADARGRTIDFRLGPLPDAVGDPILIRQVFVNLLANAVKFTRRREPAVIEVSGRVEADRLLYVVRDNGAGFDPRYAEKLFGVFQRLHRQDDFEGTGVGLAFVQRILLRHGGRIWAEAAVDQGATFSFSLPPPPVR